MADFEWPWEYNFPPFFTIQPNEKTREAQLATWGDLVLRYQRHNNDALLSLNEPSALFANPAIGRTLQPEGRLSVLEHLERRHNAAACDKSRQQWEIYWHTLDEWAQLLYKWASAAGMTNTICTYFELTEGDLAAGQPWHKLNLSVLLKALRTLEKQGKCELIGEDDEGGVKFF